MLALPLVVRVFDLTIALIWSMVKVVAREVSKWVKDQFLWATNLIILKLTG